MNRDYKALLKAIDAYIEKADDDLADALDAAGFIDATDTVKEISRLEERIAQSLKKETAYVKEALDATDNLKVFADEIWPKMKLDDELSDNLSRVFFDEFTSCMPELVSHYTAKIDPEIVVDSITKRTTSWVKSWSNELGDIMQLNSHNEIENMLSISLEKGQSVAEFTQVILDSGIRSESEERWQEDSKKARDSEYYKARRVSITEMLRAHSVAQHESFVQSPAVEKKMWRHTGSHRNEPRPNHVEMDGKRVPKNEPFVLKGADGITYYPMYPRDSILPAGEAVSCHCIEEPIVSEEILGLPLEERQRLQAEAIADDDGEWEKELDAKNRAKAGIE